MVVQIVANDNTKGSETKKAHSWRRCPIGQHFVKEHTIHIQPSKKHPKGELRDYLVRVPWNKLLDPTSNICIGIRWLFQKKKLASVRLKRTASWDEAVIEYKSYWDTVNKGQIPVGLAKFRNFYEILQGE